MSADEQRIAIAEFCGIEVQNLSACCAESAEIEEYGICPACHDHTVFEPDTASLPDYPNDLNVMHEAEKFLRPPNRHDYSLWQCYLNNFEEDPHADAKLRAESFVKAIAKWKEENR